MHDPKSVAHEITLPWKNKDGLKTPFLTIWHNDPCTDGTDDSCGAFIRTRHIHEKAMGKVRHEFEFRMKNNYWFDEDGTPKFSTIGTLVDMYSAAMWQHCLIYYKGHEKRRRIWKKFLNGYMYEIIHLAENHVDCIGDRITNKWGYEGDELKGERMGLAGIVYADILRKIRPWYKHPKWHVHHWSFQFHPFQQLKKRWWDKCCKCGTRGFTGAVYANWEGTKRWCHKCEGADKVTATEQAISN